LCRLVQIGVPGADLCRFGRFVQNSADVADVADVADLCRFVQICVPGEICACWIKQEEVSHKEDN
jgi:hypothetical protein